VGNGNVDVGNKTPTRKPDQPFIDDSAGAEGSSEPRIKRSSRLRAERPKVCGAMSQQRGDRGNLSAPQKLVHLVGCRDANIRSKASVDPHPPPRKL
jgi:hypothetical protein